VTFKPHLDFANFCKTLKSEENSMSKTPEFKIAFDSWLAGCKNIYLQHCAESSFTPVYDWEVRDGARYYKIVHNGSIYCFIDKINGDVLKAASRLAPAKHARGNIFDADNGLKFMGPYGAAYLR
jgi:hypothetical protein